MLRDILHEIFFLILGVFLLFCPLTGASLGNWAVFFAGVMILMGLAVTYTVGFHFDKKFKQVFLLDKDLNSKLPLALTSPSRALRLRAVRATMYARNIVLPRGTKKNWIQESWFHGYNFRENARLIDIITSYLYVTSVLVFLSYSFIVGVYQIYTGQLFNN